MPTGIDLVREWHAAVNEADADRLAQLVTVDVRIGGPRGTTEGLTELLDWVERTRIRMTPTDWYQRGETVVVCQQAAWPDESGELGDPQQVVTVFNLRDGRIGGIARYSNLPEALSVAGLAVTDRIQTG